MACLARTLPASGDDRMAHQVAHPVAVGIGIESNGLRNVRPGDGFGPAGAIGGLKLAGELQTGALCFGERVDATSAEVRRQAGEDRGGGRRVAKRRVPPADGNAQPGGKRVERKVRQVRIGDRAEQANAQCTWLFPRQAGAASLVCDDGKVEPDRVSDEQASRPKLLEAGEYVDETGRAMHIGVGNSVNCSGRWRDRNPGIYERFIGRARIWRAERDRYPRKLDDTRLGDVEAGRFGVNRNRIERRKRRGAGNRS